MAIHSVIGRLVGLVVSYFSFYGGFTIVNMFLFRVTFGPRNFKGVPPFFINKALNDCP